ncbi:MAG: hemerythrin domain-containing protein [Comamonadaceae bacterium]|nr:hemerythrin domain-containing protein [Comamonadaceae bacterium]
MTSERWDELLKQDHEVTERVFAAMESRVRLARPGRRRRWWAGCVDYLHDYVDRCHNQKEEQHLFPLLERARHAAPRRPAGGDAAASTSRRAQILARLVPLAARTPAGDTAALAGAARRVRRLRRAVQGPLLEGERHPLPDGAADADRGRRGGGGARHRGGRGVAGRRHARALLPRWPQEIIERGRAARPRRSGSSATCWRRS